MVTQQPTGEGLENASSLADSEAGVDASLLRRHANGQPAAFGQLYDRHDRRCLDFIRRLLASADDASAEDLHQEVWIAVARQGASFDPNKARFVTWLFTIARHKVVEHLRQRAGPVRLAADLGEPVQALLDAHPDVIRFDAALTQIVQAYLAQGGKLLLSGESGLHALSDGFAIEVGAEHLGRGPFDPDYMLPIKEFQAEHVASPMVMYAASQRIRVSSGRSLGQVYDPYFNRTAQHFCNHLHTPRRPGPSGFDCGVITPQLIYLAHPVFSNYRDKGSVAHKQVVGRAIDHLLGEGRSIETNLPSYGRVSLRHQPVERRHVVHLLCAAPMNCGTVMGQPIDVVEGITPLHDVAVVVRSSANFARATLEPQGRALEMAQVPGGVRVTLPRLDIHQMVVLHHHVASDYCRALSTSAGRLLRRPVTPSYRRHVLTPGRADIHSRTGRPIMAR